MGRLIHSNYYEDAYTKYECQSCKRCFIVGETLSRGMIFVCPYCRSACVEVVAAASEENSEDMDMGCLGLYYNLYGDGSLMLYTEREFSAALTQAAANAGGALPLTEIMECVNHYCAMRDGRPDPRAEG
jgi:DNA-directed RNA polymerase subunit RPC12/RpoP